MHKYLRMTEVMKMYMEVNIENMALGKTKVPPLPYKLQHKTFLEFTYVVDVI